MYRTLGCFHSLEPTQNPFQEPNIPCLTAAGFSRWQTLQLLLCPEDSKRYLQRSVELWDIPRPDGGYFPRPIPDECFPTQPDGDMERWYTHVIGTLNQDKYMRRLKASPHQSPYPEDRRDGYFANGAQRPTRTDSHDGEQAKLAAFRRRSSVPDIVSPNVPSIDRNSYWDSEKRHDRKARSHSAQRPPHHVRQRSHTTSTPTKHNQKPPHSPTDRRHGSNPIDNSRSHRTGSRPTSSSQPYPPRNRPTSGRGPSPARDNTGSEASSEDSRNGSHPRPRRSDEEQQEQRRSSLWPPSFFKSHKRRHSSDASYRKIEAKPALPPRPEYYPPPPQVQKVQHPSLVFQNAPSPNPRAANNVRFRSDIFGHDASQNSAPETPLQAQPSSPYPPGFDPRAQGQPPPTIRYPEQQPSAVYPTQQMEGISLTPLTRESSGSNGNDKRHSSQSDWEKHMQRKHGGPVRVSTVTGVSGRVYPNTDVNAAERAKQQQARVRGSLSTAA